MKIPRNKRSYEETIILEESLKKLKYFKEHSLTSEEMSQIGNSVQIIERRAKKLVFEYSKDNIYIYIYRKRGRWILYYSIGKSGSTYSPKEGEGHRRREQEFYSGS